MKKVLSFIKRCQVPIDDVPNLFAPGGELAIPSMQHKRLFPKMMNFKS